MSASILDQVMRSLRRPSRLLYLPFLTAVVRPAPVDATLVDPAGVLARGQWGEAFRLAVGNLILLRYDRGQSMRGIGHSVAEMSSRLDGEAAATPPLANCAPAPIASTSGTGDGGMGRLAAGFLRRYGDFVG